MNKGAKAPIKNEEWDLARARWHKGTGAQRHKGKGREKEKINNASFGRLIPLRLKTTAGHGPASPEQDRFANRIFFNHFPVEA